MKKEIKYFIIYNILLCIFCGCSAFKLDRGTDPDARGNDFRGITALMIAAEKGRTETVNALIDKGADIEVKSNFMRQTALMFAAQEGHTDTLNSLIAKGANIEAATIPGWAETMETK